MTYQLRFVLPGVLPYQAQNSKRYAMLVCFYRSFASSVTARVQRRLNVSTRAIARRTQLGPDGCFVVRLWNKFTRSSEEMRFRSGQGPTLTLPRRCNLLARIKRLLRFEALREACNHILATSAVAFDYRDLVRTPLAPSGEGSRVLDRR